MPENRRWTPWLILSAAVVVADLATKAWVSHVFTPGDVLDVTPFFNLVLTHNTGAAFSFLAGAGGWQRWFFTAIAVAISAAIVALLPRQRDPWMRAALALVLGGALGNLYDRLTLGRVVDFIQLHAGGYYWPALRGSASSLLWVVFLWVWDRFFGRLTQRPQEERP